jgi:TonB family protein
LRKETDFAKQRAFLLASIGCALLFPLIQIQSSLDIPGELRTVVLQELSPTAPVVTTQSWSTTDILLAVYLLIALLLCAPFLLQAFRLYRTVRNGPGKYRDSYFVIESNDNIPSWSFFKLIYIGRSVELTTEDRELVVKHEMLHGQLYHSADMLFATLLCIVFWFNPVAWFYRRTLAKVHEFQVDAIVANQNVAGYTELLVRSALAGNGFLLTHHFNQSFILKRINMITTMKNRISNWKVVALALSLVIYFVSVSCSEVDDREAINQPDPYTGEIFDAVDNTASPVGGMEALSTELGSVLKYPKSAKEKGIQGKVFVEFVVRPDGTLSDIKVKQGFDEDCDYAAMVAVSKLKAWSPPSHGGKPVAQRFVLPIVFSLE